MCSCNLSLTCQMRDTPLALSLPWCFSGYITRYIVNEHVMVFCTRVRVVIRRHTRVKCCLRITELSCVNQVIQNILYMLPFLLRPSIRNEWTDHFWWAFSWFWQPGKAVNVGALTVIKNCTAVGGSFVPDNCRAIPNLLSSLSWLRFAAITYLNPIDAR